MKLCSDDHEEVCYESCLCPVCDVRDDLQGTIDELDKEIGNLEKCMES